MGDCVAPRSAASWVVSGTSACGSSLGFARLRRLRLAARRGAWDVASIRASRGLRCRELLGVSHGLRVLSLCFARLRLAARRVTHRARMRLGRSRLAAFSEPAFRGQVRGAAAGRPRDHGVTAGGARRGARRPTRSGPARKRSKPRCAATCGRARRGSSTCRASRSSRSCRRGRARRRQVSRNRRTTSARESCTPESCRHPDRQCS